MATRLAELIESLHDMMESTQAWIHAQKSVSTSSESSEDSDSSSDEHDTNNNNYYVINGMTRPEITGQPAKKSEHPPRRAKSIETISCMFSCLPCRFVRQPTRPAARGSSERPSSYIEAPEAARHTSPRTHVRQPTGQDTDALREARKIRVANQQKRQELRDRQNQNLNQTRTKLGDDWCRSRQTGEDVPGETLDEDFSRFDTWIANANIMFAHYDNVCIQDGKHMTVVDGELELTRPRSDFESSRRIHETGAWWNRFERSQTENDIQEANFYLTTM